MQFSQGPVQSPQNLKKLKTASAAIAFAVVAKGSYRYSVSYVNSFFVIENLKKLNFGG